MLKQLRLKKSLEMERGRLTELETREAALKVREDALATSIEEAATDDDLTLVDTEADVIAADKAALDAEKATLTQKIQGIEDELTELEKNGSPTPVVTKPAERTEVTKSMIRTNKFFTGYQRAEVEEIMKRSEVVEFAAKLRSLFGEKRAVTGGDLNIPEIFLGILRDNLDKYSKLISKVNLKSVKGNARQNIAGTIPEAVWMEMIGKLNALSISFNQVEVDGYKVGGFVALPNYLVKDSDVNLVSEAMYAIAQAIGLALDKAILFGTGTKMPVGIMTRILEALKPGYWGTNEKAWTDLRTTHNLFSVNTAKGTAFYEDFIAKLGVIKSNYSNGQTFWAMARTTHANLTVKAISMNAAGALVSGVNNQMPIIGGEIVELDFIPDGLVIGGYGDIYLLAEREGAVFATSDQVQFVEDNTVVKGIARYDGRPVFGEAFVAVNIGAAVVTVPGVTFVTDAANA